MDNLIDKLSCTLNAANLNISKVEVDVEDLKDEVLDDLEEEVLQAEMSSDCKNQGHRGGGSSNNNYQSNPNKQVNNNNYSRPGATNSRNNSRDVPDEDDEDDIVMVKNPISNSSSNTNRGPYSNSRQSRNVNSGYGNSDEGSNDLGATNHMQSRINSLEK
jgi:hypothetical protein